MTNIAVTVQVFMFLIMSQKQNVSPNACGAWTHDPEIIKSLVLYRLS